jgi:archaellum component FlaG (FlaF/FlaG flagellin family)
MADGGASSMVMLITALLISGGASALLISEWSDAVRIVQANERASDVRGEVSVALAGDPAMVAHNTTTKTITLFFLNTGSYDLDTSDYEVLIDGAAPTSSTESVLPSGTEWNPGDLLEIVLTDSSWSYVDGEDISVYFIGLSESVSGYTYSATTNAEVRLNAFA